MSSEYKQFETARLRLNPTTIDDSEFVLQVMNTPKWIQYIGDRNVHTIQDAEEYINHKMTPLLEKAGYSNYTMTIKSDGTKIGSCGLYDREGIDGVDIGFALLPEYEGQGYGYEAALKILEAARDIFHLRKLLGITVPENKASQKLLEKLGLVHIETLDWDGEDLMLYQIWF